MTWCDVEGHDQIADYFRCALARHRMASTFLFLGPSGVGKRRFCRRLAQALLCEATEPTELAPCRTCAACQQIDAGSHPDVEFYGRPEDKKFIPLETFIGDREHRGREGLCYWITRKPSSGRRRIAVIDDADYLNPEGANSLLKTLEEPPPKSLLILLGTSQHRQLPTIRSRCQILRFRPLAADVIERLLKSHHEVSDPEELQRLTALAEGSLDRALRLRDEDLEAFYREFRQVWGRGEGSSAASKQLQSFVNAAGKDAPPRRARLRNIVELCLRDLQAARDECVNPTDDAEDDATWAQRFRSSELIGQQLERCLVALEEIDANANLATLIECWIDDLAQIALARDAANMVR